LVQINLLRFAIHSSNWFNMAKLFLIVSSVFLVFVVNLNAQINASIPTAFLNSYNNEANKLYDKAIDDLMVVYDPKIYEINVRLGWLYYYMANYEESKKYYKKAIDLMPKSVEARLGFVLPASALANWDAVLEQYLEILKIDDKNSTVNYFVGLIFYNRSDFVSAEQYFEKVYSLYPFNYDTVIMLALTKQKRKKNEEAKLYYNKALIFYPTDQTAIEGLKSLE
jgi:tetratricopeptide (TPR) repeat protein